MYPLSYKEFLQLLKDSYKPLPYEKRDHEPRYRPGDSQANWAIIHSVRFYRAYRCCVSFAKPAATFLDLGAYPGTMLRIIGLIYGEDINLVGTGFSCEATFAEDMQREGIHFVPSDLDVVSLGDTQYPKTVALPDGSVDFAFATEIIEHLYSVRPLFGELNRLLKPGGAAYITTPNVTYWVGMLRLLRGETNLDVDLSKTSALAQDEWRGHVRYYSLNQLKNLAQHFGFEVIGQDYFHLSPPLFIINKKWWLPQLFKKSLDFFVPPKYRVMSDVLFRKPTTLS